MASCTIRLISAGDALQMHLAPPPLTITACTYPYPQTVPPDLGRVRSLAVHPNEQAGDDIHT